MEQIFNSGETGLCYKYLPATAYATVDERSPSGFKSSKERLTLLACSNSAGTCKMKLTVKGKSKNPRVLKGIRILPVNYKANKKVWVTQEL